MGFLGFKKDKTAYFTKRLDKTLDMVFEAFSSEVIKTSEEFIPADMAELQKLRLIVEQRLSGIPALIALENGARGEEQKLLSEILTLSSANADLADETGCYTTPMAVYFAAETPAIQLTIAIYKRNPIIDAISCGRNEPVAQHQILERNLGYFVEFVLCNYHEMLFSGIRANQFVKHLQTFEKMQLWRNKFRILVNLFNESQPAFFQELHDSLKTLESSTTAMSTSLVSEEYWITKRDAYAALAKHAESVVSNTEAAMLDWNDAERLRRSAEQGDAQSQFTLGHQYYEGWDVPQDYTQAEKWLRLAAGQGNALAQLNLGLMYAEGRGVPQNDIETVRWFRLAAEQGHAGAQLDLGTMYRDGDGVEQDDTEAIRWYRLAAEQGNADAQFWLGWMYAKGRGVSESGVRAYMWCSLAAAQGGRDLRDLIATIANTLTPQQLQEAQALATRCFESGYKDCD